MPIASPPTTGPRSAKGARSVPSSGEMATDRKRYHHGDLPTALKQAAVVLIAQHGVEGFSLREAALAVGVSPSAAYRHFDDKAALLGVIAQDAFREMGQRFQSAMASVRGSGSRAARARFMAQGHAYVGFALEQPERFAVMFGPYGAGATMPNSAACDHPGLDVDSPYASLSRVLDELLAAGAIDSARRPGAELLAWSAIHGLATLLVSQALKQTALPVEAMVERVGQDCLRALKAPLD
ncbi:MAG: TetR/AcrR family transcriptional regulator [Betaproteobacteria bacterium]|nr:TetR/AcrR family transcriptional regulator [Betaproteobacteria bacterium]